MISIDSLIKEVKDLRHDYEHAKFGSKLAQIKHLFDKQDKLLKLYKELSNVRFLETQQILNGYNTPELLDRKHEIINQIEVLEKEGESND